MSNYLSRTVAFWGRGIAHSGRSIVTLTFAILSALLAIRDGVLPKEWREVFLAEYIPQLPWYWWAIISLASVICFIFFAVPTLHDRATLEYKKAFRKRLRESEARDSLRYLVRNARATAQAVREDKPKDEPPAPKPKPIFKVLPITAFVGLIELDVNVFSKTKKNRGVLFPMVVSFENLPQPNGFNESDEVWAHITYKDATFGGMELARQFRLLD